MAISRVTFDSAKNWYRLRFHKDRPLIDSEFNELQDRQDYERLKVLHYLHGPKAYTGLSFTPDIPDENVAIGPGTISYLGHIYNFSGTTTLSTEVVGTISIYLEILKYNLDKSDEPVILAHPNELDDRDIAERENWVYSILAEDTTGDVLPTGATTRIVELLYTYNFTTEVLTTTWKEMFVAGDKGRFEDHLGSGGDSHALVTDSAAGFMSSAQKIALSGHIGIGGTTQHPLATDSLAGFISPDEKAILSGLSGVEFLNADITPWNIYKPLNGVVGGSTANLGTVSKFMGKYLYSGGDFYPKLSHRKVSHGGSLPVVDFYSKGVVSSETPYFAHFTRVRTTGSALTTYPFVMPADFDASNHYVLVFYSLLGEPQWLTTSQARTWTWARATMSTADVDGFTTPRGYADVGYNYFTLNLKGNSDYAVCVLIYTKPSMLAHNTTINVAPWFGLDTGEDAEVRISPRYFEYLNQGGKY